MRPRKELVTALIEYKGDIGDIIEELSQYHFDSEPLAVLTKQHIVTVLERYLKDTILASEVEYWIDAVEMRDDIDYETGYEGVIGETLFKLSQQQINEILDNDMAKQIILDLLKATPNNTKEVN